MKIAVCYSGLIRGDVLTNIESLVGALGDAADYYFTTWTDQATKDIPITERFEQPEMHYNPAVDPIGEFSHYYQRFIRNKQAHGEAWKDRSKQIIAHAHAVKSLPKAYDMIVRVRYDTVFGKQKTDIYNYIYQSYEENVAYGFFTPRHSRNPDDINSTIQLDRNNERRNKHLVDHLIIHPKNIFDPEYVFKLHHDKKLMVAEYGWYQVLSKNNDHRCFKGLGGLEKL